MGKLRDAAGRFIKDVKDEAADTYGDVTGYVGEKIEAAKTAPRRSLKVGLTSLWDKAKSLNPWRKTP